jgi:hypothetical protein
MLGTPDAPKGIHFNVVQTSCPYGWRWTVLLGTGQIKSGTQRNRARAVNVALRVITEARKAKSLEPAEAKSGQAAGGITRSRTG